MSATGLLVIAVALAAWMAALLWVLWLVRRGSASRRWPTVEGEVSFVEVKTVRGDGLDVYVPIVKYRYHVEGRDYRGERIDATAGHRFLSQRRAARALEGYFPQRPVRVHYNPRRPEESLLRPGSSGGMWTVVGALLALGITIATLVNVVTFE